MLRNYLLTVMRSLARQKEFTMINIIGLAIGVACSTLIMSYVKHEMSYDRFHSKEKQIFRVIFDIEMKGRERTRAARSPWAAGPALLEDWDEVIETAHVSVAYNVLASSESNQIRVDNMAYADSTIFRIFDYPLLTGDPATVLKRPDTAVITKDIADRLFPDTDPIGQTIKLNNLRDVEITGILGANPGPSHLDFSLLMSRTGFPVPEGANTWFAIGYCTYVLLAENTDYQVLNARFPELIERHAGEYVRQHGMEIFGSLQPLRSVYLTSDLQSEPQKTGSYYNIVVFTAIALIILIIACINYINLTTARLTNRAREVGIRKVFGAHRRQLFLQFLIESSVIILFAFVLAYVFVEILIPVYNSLVNQPLVFSVGENELLFAEIAALFVLVIVVAGVAPALVFSSFRAINTIKGQIKRGPTGEFIRKVLVVFQFSCSIFLMVATIVVFRQIEFMKNQDHGFDKKQIIYLPTPDKEFRESLDIIKSELEEHSAILNCSGTSSIPGKGFPIQLIMPEGIPDDQVMSATMASVDPDFLETYGIELVEGRFFNDEIQADSTNWVINQAMARKLGWTNPVGRGFDLTPRGVAPGEVIGVVRDYNYASLADEIEPFVMHKSVYPYRYLSIRFMPGREEAALEHIRTVWDRHAAQWPFEYYFLDEEFDKSYLTDLQLGETIGAFASLAIIIASLGLFGLAAFSAEQRNREIVIRRILGASTDRILLFIIQDFMKLLLLSNLIAWVLAWFIMQRWLENFAQHTPLNLEPLLISGIAALGITLVTVSYQAVRSVFINPVDVLRYE